MHTASRISLLVLSLLVGGGGVMGYLKAQSKASLISGVISAALLAVAYYVSGRNWEQGLIFGGVISALLCVVFGIRLKKTGKMMPSGMLLGLCAAELIFIVVSIVTK